MDDGTEAAFFADHEARKASRAKAHALRTKRYYRQERSKANLERRFHRWKIGTVLRDKRSGESLIYLGNVVDPYTQERHYLVRQVLEFSNEPGLAYSLPYSKDIVKHESWGPSHKDVEPVFTIIFFTS